MKRPAFTLIELLVVTAVFAVVFLVAIGVYTNGFSKQQAVQSKQRVASEGRYLLESMARTVRVGSIDYGYYQALGKDSLIGAQQILALRDETNTRICYWVDPATHVLSTSSTCAAPWVPITPSDIQISSWAVWIAPVSNPYMAPPAQSSDCAAAVTTTPGPPVTIVTGYDSTKGICACQSALDCWNAQSCDSTSHSCNSANVQPSVTINMTTATQANAKYPASTNLQTSVVTRSYLR